MKKIVVLDGYAANPGDISWDAMEELGELTVYDRTPKDLVISRMRGADAVFTNKVVISRETLEACPEVKFIGVLATGYNIVDVVAAKQLGVTVCNVPAYSTEAVGQFAIALLLEICSHVGHHSDAVHSGRWENSTDFCFWDSPLIELAGKTMGIIGFGRIGQTTGRIAKAMGMHVIAYNRHRVPNEICRYVEMDELLATSDVISLHCPLFPETRGMINKETIAKMKDGVILINNSRGPLICEQDLADALNSGKIYAAGVDVVSEEPIQKDNPLLKAKNCIITPHISWACLESRRRLMDISVENLRRFLEGIPINVVS